MAKRVFLIVLDSFGIGRAPDADKFGDHDVNTIRSCAKSEFFKLPNLKKLGLFNIDGLDFLEDEKDPVGRFARLKESSMGKDTTTGHWEMTGIISEKPMPTFPDGFPEEVIEKFKQATGRGVLCNKPYSGTQVINDYGDEHIKTGDLIVYTSADSVFQIAAHEDVVPVETLYEYCRMARRILTGDYAVGRVIARPFIGTSGKYERTPRRHDFSLEPSKENMMEYIKNAGLDSIAVGKIKDIFAGVGITEFVYTSGNAEGIDRTIEYMDKDFEGLCFVNLVDTDMIYGHRRDIDGYAKALSYFDDKLAIMLEKMRDDDMIMITADHGCDPGYTETTDHTREYVPLVFYKKGINPGNLGTYPTFACIAETVLDYLNVSGKLPEEASSLL